MSEGDLIHHYNDRYFKESFSRVELVEQFLGAFLTGQLWIDVHWSRLKLEPASFVDERLAHCSSDLLYSALMGEKEVLLYFLFEHQRTVDRDMPFRLLTYMVRIWEQWRKQQNREQKAPYIVPIVLHQGSQHWTVSTHFRDWLEVPEATEAEMGRYIPDFEHVLVDLSRISMEQIRGRLLLQVSLGIMQAVARNNLVEWLSWSEPLLSELLDHPDTVGFFNATIEYALCALPEVADPGTGTWRASRLGYILPRLTNQKLKDGLMSIAEELELDPRDQQEEHVMSIAEALIERGRREGRREVLREQSREAGQVQGRIQLCQELLGLPVMTDEELAKRDSAWLANLQSELSARLKNRQQ